MKYTNQNQEYADLRAKARLYELFARIRSGFGAFGHNPVCWAWTVAYWLLALALPRITASLLGFGPVGAKLLSAVFLLAAPLFLALYLILVAVSATPRRAWAVTDAFLRVGMVNRAGEAPFVVAVTDRTIEVRSNGIPLSEFEDRRDELESALNLRLTRMEQGNDKRHIILHTAPGTAKLPTRVLMDYDQFPEGDAVFSLGVTEDGPVVVNLKNTPHILAGGSTGSGKTNLVGSLLQQAIDKGMDVYLLDMKGGIDFPFCLNNDLCHIATTRYDSLSILSQLVDVLEDRKDIFQCVFNGGGGRPCSSIDVYNRYNPDNKLPRILVACDELGQLTDAGGESKANKEEVAAIVGKLSTLARLGRAFGIHLLLATQRPDANVVPGQIKNNLDIRVCGRADLVLSQIIMDNGSANDLPKDIPGRFITNLGGGTIFQGYMLPDLDNDDTDDNKDKNDNKDNGNKDDGTIMEGDVDGLPFDGGDSPDTHS